MFDLRTLSIYFTNIGHTAICLTVQIAIGSQSSSHASRWEPIGGYFLFTVRQIPSRIWRLSRSIAWESWTFPRCKIVARAKAKLKVIPHTYLSSAPQKNISKSNNFTQQSSNNFKLFVNNYAIVIVLIKYNYKCI